MPDVTPRCSHPMLLDPEVHSLESHLGLLENETGRVCSEWGSWRVTFAVAWAKRRHSHHSAQFLSSLPTMFESANSVESDVAIRRLQR
jgi:hypothetical protein